MKIDDIPNKPIKLKIEPRGYGKAMFELKDYTKDELIELIVSLRNENKFLKQLYAGTKEFKSIQDYLK